jgi:predicted Fe-S protein YdhL (DUF1289 family)
MTDTDDTTDREAEKEAKAAAAFERIKTGTHWADWTYVADGLVVGRAKAMRRAGTNQPFGRGYTKAFSDWMSEQPWAKALDTATRNHCFWCADHRSEIEEWRATLAQDKRALLNHPTTVRRKYEATHKDEIKNPLKPRKETQAQANARENIELWDKVKKLEREARDGGSLFDLKNDSVEDIAMVIVSTMSADRLKRLLAAIKKRASKQAG